MPPSHLRAGFPTRSAGAALLLCLVFVLCGVAPLSAQRGYHVDEQHGFKLKLPAKWQRYPVERDRRFVRGHYVSAKSWPIKGARVAHRPVLRVIVLPKIDPPAKSDGEIRPKPVVEFYADYEDYLRRNLSGTVKFVGREAGEVRGVTCTKLTIRRRKDRLAYDVTTWVFDLGKVSVAVEYYVLQQHAAKLKKTVQAGLKSFRRLPSSATASSRATRQDPYQWPLWVRDPKRWAELSSAKRLAKRATFGQSFLAAAEAGVLPGWKMKRTDNFLVLSDTDQKYTDAVGKAAEACRAWCETRLGSISDETVMPAVIRVFGQRSTHRYYRTRSKQLSHYVPSIREVVIRRDRDQVKSIGALGDLLEGVVHQFVADKDQALYRNLPPWLRDGVNQFFRMSKLNRGKLEFVASDREKKIVRNAIRRDRLESVIGIITQTTLEKDDEARALRYQRGGVVRFLQSIPKLVGDDFLRDYYVAVREAQAQHGVAQRNPGAGRVPGVSEDDREASGKARRESRTQLLENVNAKVVSWDDSTWDKVAKAYARHNKKL